MTNYELDEMINWCRKKLSNKPFGLSGKRMEGYDQAMKTVCHIYIVRKQKMG